MEGYRIYLTRSTEVAEIIAKAKSDKMAENKIARVSHGCAYGCHSDLLPGIYRTMEYEYCLVEYEGLSVPKYEIVFA